MKRLFLLLTLASAMPLAALAQDDDLTSRQARQRQPQTRHLPTTAEANAA